jgi:hypothetical protein
MGKFRTRRLWRKEVAMRFSGKIAEYLRVRSGNVTIRLQWQDLTISIPDMFPVGLRTSLEITTDGDIAVCPVRNFFRLFNFPVLHSEYLLKAACL